MEVEQIITKIKELDLSTYPKKEIEDLIKKAGNIGYIIVTFHKNKSVMRARPNYDGERFSKKSDFSFKPQKLNDTYQRASTPNQTMFYATSIPDKIEKGELDNMRVVGVAETINMMRDKTKSGYQKISFGKWHVEEDINLLAIIHKDTYLKESSYTRELVGAYNSFIKQSSVEFQDRSFKFHNFLADEFSKEVEENDYDYIISAIFSEMATNKGFDGVIYPSVRVRGKGFNIAITPKATKKLGLYVAGECSLYKLKDQAVVGNDAIVELDGKQETFELIEMENHEKECLEQLGVSSIDELIKNKSR